MESPNKTNLSHPYFNNLNGLRALGALAVFLFHTFLLGHEVWGDFYKTTLFQALTKVMSKGNYGVSLFFVLSGFLISYLLMHEAKRKGTIHVFGFFMRRLLRIWPVYFVVLLFGFVVFPQLPFGVQTINSPWFYGFFLSNFEEIRVGFMDSVNFLTVLWSVSIEEQFYMSWVVLMALLPFLRRGKGFLPYFLLLIGISLNARWFYRDSEIALYYHTLTVVSDLGIGGLLAYSCFHWNWDERFQSISKWTNLAVYAFGIAMILGVRFVFQGDLIVLEKLVLGLFFAYIIFDQAFGKHSFFKADRIPLFFEMGKISYGFYMYHCIVIYYVQQFFAANDLTDHIGYFVGYLVLSFVLTFAISWASYRWMEVPVLRLKKRF